MKLAIAAIGILLISTVAFSATIYVPDHYPTIQAAINASVNGDTIIVRPGTYYEHITIDGKSIVVKSELGPDVTIIDGSGYSTGVVFSQGVTTSTVLDGFTIRNFNQSGIRCSLSGSTIVNNIIEHCIADEGGGIYCDRATAVIRNNRISHCEADPTLTDARGGGIFCVNSTVSLKGNVVEYNKAASSSWMTCGGGISLRYTEAIIEDNVIFGNEARCRGWNYYGDCYGGGLCAEESTVRCKGNRISCNTVEAYCGAAGGAGIAYYQSGGMIENNVITANRSPFRGGGIYCKFGPPVRITNNIVFENFAVIGGGILCYYNRSIITNNTIVGNGSSSSQGGGIESTGSHYPAVTNTILWKNAPNQMDGISQVNFCNVMGGWAGTGNIDADPHFADPAKNDYHLAWNSPCRDTGANHSVPKFYDFEGDPRIAGGTIDMGADEFYYHLYSLGDVLPGSPIDIKVVGIPGLPALLALGTGIQDPPQSTPHGDLWLKLPLAKSWPLGPIPSTGIFTHTGTVPSGWPMGSEHPLQALVGPWGGGATRLTNLHVLEVE
jgi:hypothetical protein